MARRRQQRNTNQPDGGTIHERQARIETILSAHIETTERLVEELSRSIEGAGERAEESARAQRDSFERITGDIFRKIDSVNAEALRRFDDHAKTTRPNFAALVGVVIAIVIPAAALVSFSVNSAIAPIRESIKSQGLVNDHVREHQRKQEGQLFTLTVETARNEGRQNAEARELKAGLGRLQTLIDGQAPGR